MNPIFSTQPGPHERQLQRMHNNPLFGGDNQVTPVELAAAQLHDKHAAEEFMQQFRQLVQRVVSLEKQTDSDTLLQIKAQLEQQFALAAGMQGDNSAVLGATRRLISTIAGTLRNAAQNEHEAQEKLRLDEEHTALHLELCSHPIVSDILNPVEVIAEDELVPSLLSESQAGLAAALALFPPQRVAELVEQGKALLKKVEAAGHSLPEAWRALGQMEEWGRGGETQ
ncbi:MAG TPA: hypothetical protein VFR06_10340 [Gallionellaceae bacterium]|nr:hypothetical protein [Gallionellaceae bacterium]